MLKNIFWILGIGLVFLRAPVMAEWLQAGESLNMISGQLAEKPSIAADKGNPYVAWHEHHNHEIFRVYVKKWTGSNWEAVGTCLNVNESQHAKNPSLAVVDDMPFVSFSEYNSEAMAYQVIVKYWNNASWIQLGSCLNVNPNQWAINSKLVVYRTFPGAFSAWAVWIEGGQLVFKRWNGSEWIQDGGSLNVDPARDANDPTLARYPTGLNMSAFVAWRENNGSVDQVFIRQASWSQIPGEFVWRPAESLNLNTSRNAGGPCLAIASPYVAWIESNGVASQINVKFYYNGLKTEPYWGQVGESLNIHPSNSGYYPGITVIGNVPYVCWSEAQQLYVKHFDGAWKMDGGSLNVNPNYLAALPCITVANGEPFVSWIESQSEKVYVKHYVYPTPIATFTPVLDLTGSLLELKILNNQIDPSKSEAAVIRWRQAKAATVTITIYNLLGQKIATLAEAQIYAEGPYHELVWNGIGQNGKIAGSGIYIVYIQAGESTIKGKIAIIK